MKKPDDHWQFKWDDFVEWFNDNGIVLLNEVSWRLFWECWCEAINAERRAREG